MGYKVALFILLALAATVMTYVTKNSNEVIGRDFGYLYATARLVVDGTKPYCEVPKGSDTETALGKKIYTSACKRYGMPELPLYPTIFPYPPTMLVVVSPFTAFDYYTARDIWRVFLLVATVAGVFALALSTMKYFSGSAHPALGLIWVFAVINGPMRDGFAMANASVLITAINCFFLSSVISKRWNAAGIALSLGGLIKVLPFMQAPALFTRSHLKFIYSFFATSALLVAASIVMVGPDIYSFYLSRVIPFVSKIAPLAWNSSVHAVITRLASSGAAEPPVAVSENVMLVSRIVLAVLFVSVVYLIRLGYKKGLPNTALFGCGALAVVGCMFSPLAWLHHYSLAVPVGVMTLYALISAMPGRTRNILVVTVVSGLVLLSLRRMVPEWYASPFLYGLDHQLGLLMILASSLGAIFCNSVSVNSNSDAYKKCVA